MHPDKKQVIPLMPEAILNTDGSEKQDCESKAAKRFISHLKQTHPRQGFLICGDGLMVSVNSYHVDRLSLFI
ncbi:MAG: hypothetical protein QM479_04240 [Pseudomonadota bacterium]